MATAPRRLRITIDIDFVTDAARRLHASKVYAAADEAIDAATGAVAAALVDDDISITYTADSEWAYVWSNRSRSETIEAGDVASEEPA